MQGFEFDDSLHKAFAKHASLLEATQASTRELRLGVLGTASIARKQLLAITAGCAGRVRCVAVGSRSLERARAFAGELGVPRALGSYEEVLALDEVDAVYIPLPTSLHAEWVRKSAAAGKHVMLEKPCALNAEELLDMLSACLNAGVFCMDAVMCECWCVV
jgi:xylose dehydrogenase (NAD/NADP)